MDALEKYRGKLRELPDDRHSTIPWFSDKDGRTAAQALFLFQDPGKSGAAKSGVADRDNEDPSAKAFREASEGILEREKTVSWNAIPWAIQGKVGYERWLVREWQVIPLLLDALPKVTVVVLCGNVARDFNHRHLRLRCSEKPQSTGVARAASQQSGSPSRPRPSVRSGTAQEVAAERRGTSARPHCKGRRTRR